MTGEPDTLTDGTVRVTHIELCGARPAEYVSEVDGVYCDVCGKSDSVVCHSHEYRYEGDARLYGEDWDTGERRELSAAEAYTYLYDGDVLGLDDVSGMGAGAVGGCDDGGEDTQERATV